MIKRIDYVSTEGGPLLFINWSVASEWKGVDQDSSDFDRACDIFDSNQNLKGAEIEVGEDKGIVWEIGGPGTGIVFRKSVDQLVIVRPWLEDPEDEQSIERMAELPSTHPVQIGQLDIVAGLVILWAAENGQCIKDMNNISYGRPTGSMCIDSAGLIVFLPEGRYLFLHDEVNDSSSTSFSWRCHIIPKS